MNDEDKRKSKRASRIMDSYQDLAGKYRKINLNYLVANYFI